jgi:serine/threonine protein kinase
VNHDTGKGSPIRLEKGGVLDGRFRLIERIGRGGFGEVWRAEELLPNGTAIRQVALKVLAPESDLGVWTEEAKLLASFSHPSLVTILAAGLVSVASSEGGEGGAAPLVLAPFVAMELLDGETLASVLARKGKIPWRRVLAWARDVAGALDVIHARGVVHLDLKPSNLFLTSAGTIKVLDFGIARRSGAASGPEGVMLGAADEAMGTAEFLAERPIEAGGARSKKSGPIVGTPGFIAPEIIEERPATCAADAYALAACIVELATGLLPQDVARSPSASARAGENAGGKEQPEASEKARAWWVEVRHATSTGRLRDLTAPPCSLPKGVAAMCKRLLALDPLARGVSAGGLRAIIDAAWERPHGVPDPPYRGLVAFGPESEGVLFGRDDDTARLARELEDRAALVLQGISGSGKSSLAMAGIIPAVARRFAASGPDYQAVIVRPGPDPDGALEEALASIAPELARASAAEVAAHCGPRAIGIAFIFDQLEELVTQAPPERRARFVRFLAEAVELPGSAPVRVVGTLREDFTSGLLAIEPLGDRLRDALRFIGPPTAAAVREIVGQPARLAGARIEGLGEVADEVQRELRSADGRLPLVALALAAWWKTREEDPEKGAVLRAKAWATLGGVRRIFADIADGVFAALPPAAQAEARAILLALGRDARTRRSVPRAELRAAAKNPAAFDEAARAFMEAGLLVQKGEALEIVHEALLTSWERLAGWLADAQASRRIASALVEGASAWEDLGRPVTRLPGASEVALAELSLKEGGLVGEDAARVRGWLGARRERTFRERVQTAAIGAALLLLIAVALGFWAQTVSVAQERAEEAKREAVEAAKEARKNEERAAAARVLAAEAKEEADKSRAEREKAAQFVKKQQEQFERMLKDAEGETEKMRVKCALIESAPRVRTGGCPPGDKLCAAGQ